MSTITIVPYDPKHWPGVWAIFSAVVQGGDTYDYPADTTETQAKGYWIAQPPQQVFVALDATSGTVVGTYFMKPNRVGNGSHVANAGFMVCPNARGLGVGRAMGQHAMETAKAQGFVAMQFNLVVSVNTPAVRLWQSLGFKVVATLPKAFKHRQQGLVDAYIMYQLL